MKKRLVIVATNHKEDSKLTRRKMEHVFEYNPDEVLLECCWKALRRDVMRDQYTAFMECLKMFKMPRFIFNSSEVDIPDELKSDFVDNRLSFHDCYNKKPEYCKKMEKEVGKAFKGNSCVCVVCGAAHVKHLTRRFSKYCEIIVIKH